MDVNEWINNECAESMLPHIHSLPVYSFTSVKKGENITRNRSEIARVNGPLYRSVSTQNNFPTGWNRQESFLGKHYSTSGGTNFFSCEWTGKKLFTSQFFSKQALENWRNFPLRSYPSKIIYISWMETSLQQSTRQTCICPKLDNFFPNCSRWVAYSDAYSENNPWNDFLVLVHTKTLHLD
jgi:hypothetical protein